MNIAAMIGFFLMAFIVGAGLTSGAIVATAALIHLKELFDYLTAPSLEESNGKKITK